MPRLSPCSLTISRLISMVNHVVPTKLFLAHFGLDRLFDNDKQLRLTLMTSYLASIMETRLSRFTLTVLPFKRSSSKTRAFLTHRPTMETSCNYQTAQSSRMSTIRMILCLIRLSKTMAIFLHLSFCNHRM